MKVNREITDINPHTFFEFLGLGIADSTLEIMLITVVVSLIAFFVIRRFSLIPSKIQLAIESVYEFSLDLIGNIIGDEERTKKAFPIIGSIMFYLLFANLIGLIPGVEQITFNGVPIFRTATSDFNTTFGLALGSVLIINFIAIKEKGILKYLDQYIRVSVLWKGFRKSFGDGMLALVEFFIGLLDIIGELVKVISLSLRLFGNMYAGQILMVILLGFVAFVVPSVWLTMNLFVGILQAIVFASLVASYYMLATSDADTQD